ncbi:GAF domain-containing protein [Consotaella salsifontis]|uniref:Regulatory protein, Fis family n=1 Tax=Consotaella salsifontis TaxID=1365950 RepID=A0A1T4T4H7_9HYPH|nr:GAF domain-containing protein [Consotaella salsifontis]SKA35048.1 regulatory protein, Fis family [Consotaella salsifontis]
MQSVHTDHSSAIEAAIAANEAARSPLVASWSRSARLHGLDPQCRTPPKRLSAKEFREVRSRMEPLVRIASPNLDRLFQAVGGIGCCVLLADSNGIPVDRRGAAGDDSTFENWGLWTGAVWSEAEEGTNGIGTCLIEHRPVTIHRDQHFMARNVVLGCMAAPLHDHTGSLAGVIDVSSCRDDLSQGVASLISLTVTETARRIEAEIFREAFPKARITLVSSDERNAGALIAIDADDLVVGATHSARRALGLKGDLSANPVPASDLLGSVASETLGDAERAVLARALARAGGNVSAAARSIGISRATFHRKLGRQRSSDAA